MEYKMLYKIKYGNREQYLKEYDLRFNSISAYHYDFTVAGSPVFVVLTNELLQYLVSIKTLDKKIFKLLLSIPQVAYCQFMDKCLIDEVKQTNEIEGVVSTRREIKDVLDNKPGKNKRLDGIVQKYRILTGVDKIPLKDCIDIRNLYDESLLEEVKESNVENIPDGDIFRKGRVYIKNEHGKVIHEGAYPETKIIQDMTELLGSLENPKYDRLINIAVFHFMFGYIHPFYDGNGRISRLISSYLLSCELEKITGYRLAYTIKQNLSAYYKIFKDTNAQENLGDLTPFAIFFLGIVKKSMDELCGYFEIQIEKLKYYEKKIENISISADEKDILFILVQNKLFAYEGLNIEQLRGITNKSEYKIRTVLKKLNDFDLLEISKHRPFLYSADIKKIE